MNHEFGDLRKPDQDETGLSREEVLHGMRTGHIPSGPRSRSIAFADVIVVERQRVQIFDFYREAA